MTILFAIRGALPHLRFHPLQGISLWEPDAIVPTGCDTAATALGNSAPKAMQ